MIFDKLQGKNDKKYPYDEKWDQKIAKTDPYYHGGGQKIISSKNVN